MFDQPLDAAAVTSRAKERSYPTYVRTLRYIERSQDAQLGFLDFNDARHIGSERSIYLGECADQFNLSLLSTADLFLYGSGRCKEGRR
jgi:hypothetical protein